MHKLILLTAAAAFVLGVHASRADDMKMPAMTGDSAKGKVLTDSKMMTLYTFDKDAAGKSSCTGGCASNWPPLMAASDAKPMGDWSIVTRDDGGKQWAYKGKPLYAWHNDQKAGDTTGDGMANGAWHVAQP